MEKSMQNLIDGKQGRMRRTTSSSVTCGLRLKMISVLVSLCLLMSSGCSTTVPSKYVPVPECIPPLNSGTLWVNQTEYVAQLIDTIDFCNKRTREINKLNKE